MNNITDKQIANYCGVTTKTLQNWKQPLEKEGLKYYLPTGRHHLYSGAKLITYLNEINEKDGESDLTNKAEDLQQNIESAISFLETYQKDELPKEVKDSLFKSAISNLKNAKEIADNIARV